jgi:hypothetical protein
VGARVRVQLAKSNARRLQGTVGTECATQADESQVPELPTTHNHELGRVDTSAAARSRAQSLTWMVGNDVCQAARAETSGDLECLHKSPLTSAPFCDRRPMALPPPATLACFRILTPFILVWTNRQFLANDCPAKGERAPIARGAETGDLLSAIVVNHFPIVWPRSSITILNIPSACLSPLSEDLTHSPRFGKSEITPCAV